MKFILIGFRGSGKSTVGRTLAERLKLPFFDVDEQIQKRAEMDIASIVQARGWEGFRRLEKEVVGLLGSLKEGVIASGGGVVLDEENRTLLRGDGDLIIWLKADPGELLRRLLEDKNTPSQRPSLIGLGDPGKEIPLLLREREPLYKRWADLVIDTTFRGPDQVVEEILRNIKPKSLIPPK